MISARPSLLGDPAARLALLFLAIGAVAIGQSPVLVRLADADPIASAFWRVVFALPVLAVWLGGEAAKGPIRRPSALRDHALLAFAGFCFAGDLAVWHWSIRLTSVANSTLLANFAPIFVTLGAWLCFGQRFTLLFLGGMAVAMAGAVMLVGSSFNLSPENLLGDLLGLTTAVFYGGYMLTVQQLRQRFSTATIMGYTAIVTALLLLPILLASGASFAPPEPSGWLALLALGMVTHAIGQGLIAHALAHLPAAFSSVALLFQPFVTILSAWFILAERLLPIQAAGGLVMLLGVLLAGRGSRR